MTMTIVDNESLQPETPPAPRIVEVRCGYCAGRGKLTRHYRTQDGRSVPVEGRCTVCAGRGTITVEATEP